MSTRMDIDAAALQRARDQKAKVLTRLRRLLGEQARRRSALRDLTAKARLHREQVTKLEAQLLDAAADQGELDQIKASLAHHREEVVRADDGRRVIKAKLVLLRRAVGEANRQKRMANKALRPDDLARDAARIRDMVAQERAERRVRRNQDDAAAKLVSQGMGRDGPTRERLGKSASVRVTREGAAKVLGDVPETLLRMRRAGSISDQDLKAASRYAGDYRFGLARGAMTANYDPVTSGGGGRAAGEVVDDKLAAYERWRAAADAMPLEFRTVVDAVVLQDVTLANAPGAGAAHEGETNRRAASGTLLICGLKRLTAFYG